MTDNQNETKTVVDLKASGATEGNDNDQKETKTVVDLRGVGQKAHEANEVRDRITDIHQAGVPQTADVKEREQVAQEAGEIFKEMGGKIPDSVPDTENPVEVVDSFQETGLPTVEQFFDLPSQTAATENSTPPQSPGGPALPTPPPLSVSSSVPSQADVKSK